MTPIQKRSNTANPAASHTTIRETPFQRFEDALQTVLSVRKKDVDKAVSREKKAREARRTEQPK